MLRQPRISRLVEASRIRPQSYKEWCKELGLTPYQVDGDRIALMNLGIVDVYGPYFRRVRWLRDLSEEDIKKLRTRRDN